MHCGFCSRVWLPGLVLNPAPHPHSSLSLPSTQDTHCPKGKQCQTIGQPGRPPGTGLCVPDTGADTNTALLCLRVMSVLPSSLEALLPWEKGEVWAMALRRASLWCLPSIPAAEKPQRGVGPGKVGDREGWSSQAAALFMVEGSSNKLQRSGVGRGLEEEKWPAWGGLSLKINM